MKQIKLKVTYIQIFFLLSIFVTFLPNGLIYASGKAAQIVRMMYLVQFFIYSVTIFLCAKKSLRLIKAPVIGFMVWGIILLLVTINYTRDLMKVFRAAVYLLGVLTIFLIVSYMFSYQSKKVFLMIYRIFYRFFLFQFGNGYSGTKWIVFLWMARSNVLVWRKIHHVLYVLYMAVFVFNKETQSKYHSVCFAFGCRDICVYKDKVFNWYRMHMRNSTPELWEENCCKN